MTSAATSEVTTTLTFGMSGGEDSLEIPLQSDLIIRAEANPTTGYTWNLLGSPPTCLELKSQEYEQKVSKSGKPLIGAPSTLVLRFQAIDKCSSGDLKYIYSRSWEGVEGNEPAITIHVSVTTQNEL